MSLPEIAREDLESLIEASGYPFELEVAEALDARGFAVEVSRQFFNPHKSHEGEIDILARRSFEYETRHAGRVQTHLELVIECKDNNLPYALFGFPHRKIPVAGLVDSDMFYCHIRTTDDNVPNKYALVAFGHDSSELKGKHHQFNTAIRYHQAAALELHNGKPKFNVSERLRTALTGLGGFVQASRDSWQDARKLFESMPYDPTIWVTFSLLVHRGQHFSYTGKGELKESTHTTLFTAVHSAKGSVPYAVDFVAFAGLDDALKTIEDTSHVVEKQIMCYLEPSPWPMKKGA